MSNLFTGCSLKEFRCRSNAHCISGSLLCDGVENCPDGSDESSDFDSCGRFLPSCKRLYLFMIWKLATVWSIIIAKRRVWNSSARHYGRRQGHKNSYAGFPTSLYGLFANCNVNKDSATGLIFFRPWMFWITQFYQRLLLFTWDILRVELCEKILKRNCQDIDCLWD